jgi:hypothetical protein
MIVKFFAILTSFLCMSSLAQFTYPASHQHMVVSSYKADNKPYFMPQNQSINTFNSANNQNNISIADAGLFAQQAAIYALTFSPNNYKQIDAMSIRYFSHSGWQQYMTPELLKSRKNWLKSSYRTVVLVNAWPTITTSYNNNKSIVIAKLSVLVDLYSKNKFLTRQPLALELMLEPTENLLHWQVVSWKSLLVRNKK